MHFGWPGYFQERHEHEGDCYNGIAAARGPGAPGDGGRSAMGVVTDLNAAGVDLAVALSTPSWLSNWMWGLAIIAFTLMLHAAAVVVMAVALSDIARRIEGKTWPLHRITLLAILVTGIVGWTLAVLHGIEAGIWAGAYLWLGAIRSPADAVLYSLDSFTTRGESGLELEAHWRLLGALEAADGVLLFGISTAFLFTAIDSVRTLLLKIAQNRRQRPT